MLMAMAVSVGLVLATILIHYEVLRTTSNHLRDLPIPPHLRIVAVVIAAFVGHTLEVWLYGFAYWWLADHADFGALHALPPAGGRLGFEEYLYFSAVTYTSLGFGDFLPSGHFRLLAGVEALNGLILIGWSASFTYLAMERYWPLHDSSERRRRHGRPRDSV